MAVKDGAVTLTGLVSTYAEKLAAVRAATAVYCVNAVADEVKVWLIGEPRDDADIARAIAHIRARPLAEGGERGDGGGRVSTVWWPAWRGI